MGTKPHITILHVSDPQFGKNHRFGSEEPFDDLLERMKEDLSLLEKDEGLKPDLFLLTGDLAEWGLKSEFDHALRFLEGIVEHTGIERDRVVVIPGNHDINRKKCEAYFNDCEADEEEAEPPFWPKWAHYDRLFHTFYRDVPGVTFTEEEPWSLFVMEELKVVVAGLNSTMVESHRDDNTTARWGSRSCVGLRSVCSPTAKKAGCASVLCTTTWCVGPRTTTRI